MIDYNNKLSDAEPTQAESPFRKGQQSRVNFRCSQSLRDALERSEELLLKAEQLQKELDRKSLRI